ncbi:MAG: helix-turn-helix transcriptional regulator [Clostridia bacterium]|nr:helix-turn-helix transcriptional regulator [Clostridia bacterium]
MNNFGKKLRLLRNEKQISTKELAKILRVKPSTIFKWENGLKLPRLRYIRYIAVFFDVSADYLVGLED